MAALDEVEDGAQAAVEEIRKLSHAERAAGPAQELLGSVFAALVGHRALVQAAVMKQNDEPLLRPADELGLLLEDVVEDSRAFCREKFGDSPETRVLRVVAKSSGAAAGPTGAAPPVLLAPFVAFSLHELLKNAMGAHVRHVGADRIDRLDPIEVRHGVRDGVAFVGVSDFGGGAESASLQAATTFLHTTNPEREPNYTYSRNFGAPFEGLGMGLPLAALHARYLHGELHLSSLPTTASRVGGVHASFTFDVTGDRPEPG